MSYPALCYDNLLERGTVTVTSQADGYSAANGYDWNGTDWWRPAATGTHTLYVDLGEQLPCDYFCIMHHDLGATGSTARLKKSDDGVSYSNVGAIFSPTATECLGQIFTTVWARYWAVEIVHNGATPASIGMISFGKRLDMPTHLKVGFNNLLWHDYEPFHSTTESGRDNGTVLRKKPVPIELAFNDIRATWITANLQNFGNLRIVQKPFFVMWYGESAQLKTAYCVAKKTVQPKYTTTIFNSFSIDCDAYLE